MKYRYIFLIPIIAVCVLSVAAENQYYPVNKPPLLQTQFTALPLGTVKPAGWLKDQLTIQANGLTGHLDEFWESISESAWKGGKGDAWERAPYWLDGAVPLAFLLDDQRLKDQIKPFMDGMVNSLQDNGWFGPKSNPDRWPRALALKSLTQYYEATGDEKVFNVIKQYCRFLANNPPDWPDKEWRGMRAMENLVSIYWLYRRTGDAELLKTAENIQQNCFDWSNYFIHFPWDSEAILKRKIPFNWGPVGLTAHVVNVAMAVKYPGLWYQQAKTEHFKDAVYQGLQNLDRHHGQVAGRISGDEHISGTNPTQGSELCSVVELMYSLENLLEVFGVAALADRLESLAYNANPAACTPDYWAHQYDQQSNQVLCTVAKRNWSTNSETSNLYGLEPNFGCCTANMHQGWPKFVAALWMATQDNGLAATAYGPSVVKAKVGSGVEVSISEETQYPFDGKITFKIDLASPAEFPLYFRIPAWADNTEIIAGDSTFKPQPGTYAAIKRQWKPGDIVQVNIPMKIRTETRYNNATSILRGPLYFSLKIGAEFKEIKRYHNTLPVVDWEIRPTTPWNYGLVLNAADPDKSIEVKTEAVSPVPYDTEKAPVVLKMKGKRIRDWDLKDNSAGLTPLSPVKTDQPSEDIQLIPYGSTRLRITEFPVVE